MHVVLCVLICVLAVGESALAQLDTLWSARVVTSAPGPMIWGGCGLADGGLVICGVDNPEGANQDMFVAKMDALGVVQWVRNYGRPEWDETANAVTETQDGVIVLAGYGGFPGTASAVVLIGIGQNGDSLWYHSYTGAGQTKANDITPLASGDLMVNGYKLGGDQAHSDVWLLKCTAEGDTLWTRTYGQGGTDVGDQIIELPGGNLMLVAHTNSFSTSHDYWMMKLDSSGDTLSTTVFGTPNNEACMGIAMMDTIVYMVGRSTTPTGYNHGFIARANTDGVRRWFGTITADSSEEQIRGVAVRFDGTALGVGWIGSSQSNVWPWVCTISSSGSPDTSRVFATLPQGRLTGMSELPSGGLIAYGVVSVGGVRQGYILRFGTGYGVRGMVRSVVDSSGVSGVRVGLAGTPRATITDPQGRFILEAPEGVWNVVASGRCVSSDTMFNVQTFEDTTVEANLTVGFPRFVLDKTSINFVARNEVESTDTLWVYNGGTGTMEVRSTIQGTYPPTGWIDVVPEFGLVPPLDSLAVVLHVMTDTTNDGVYDYFGLLRIRANSCPDSGVDLPVLVSVLDADTRDQTTPQAFALHGAYPNPFNAVTRISFDVPRAAFVRLNVFDINGRLVRTLWNGMADVGSQTLIFDASDLASGLYFTRMESESFTTTRKLMLLK